MRRPGRVPAVLALLVLMPLAGCAGDDEPDDRAPAAKPTASPSVSQTPDGPIAFELRQYRTDELVRRIQIVVTNQQAVPIHVVDVGMRSPGYTDVPPTRHDADIAPGRTVDLPVFLSQPLCAPGLTQSAGTVTVVATVRQGATTKKVQLPLPTPQILLDRLLTDECSLRAVRDAMTVTFGPSWQPTDQPAVLHGTVELRRRTSTEKITVEKLGSSVIIEVKPRTEDKPLAEMAPDQDTASVPVEVSTQRCDPHAVGESKQTYLLPVWLRIGDSDELFAPLQLDARQLAHLKRLIDTGCRGVPPLEPQN